MKWTDKMIDSFDREQQVAALTCVRDYLKVCDLAQENLNAANLRLSQIEAKTEQLKKSPTVITVIALLIILPFAISVLGNIIGIILIVGLFVLYLYFEKTSTGRKREAKAAEYYQQNAPAQLQAKEQAETTLALLHDSDDAYNCKMLLPEEYLVLDKVEALLNSLTQRRVRSITEAMNLYEDNQHKNRMEDIETQRLKAAQEAAEAQKQAAEAAKNTEQMTQKLEKEQKELAFQQHKMEESIKKMKTKPASSTKRKACYHCGQDISIKAAECPYCGTVPPWWWYV